MRIFLLPISTRRTLLYAYRKPEAVAASQGSIAEKIQTRAAKLWADWEKKESGWQKTIVTYGNQALRRIPYEEWGLKSVPPMSRQWQDNLQKEGEKLEVVYPRTLVAADTAPKMLQTLGTERESLHRSRLIYCLIGIPITLPFALIPVIPNIPGFYLAYRAWSHWRAWQGGKTIQYLLQNNKLSFAPSPVLDEIYAKPKLPLATTSQSTAVPGEPQNIDPRGYDGAESQGETILLDQEHGKQLAQTLAQPGLEIELERAVWQVETAIEKQNAGAKGEDEKKAQ